MRRPDLIQPIGDHAVRDFRPIAFAAEVSEIKMAQISGHHFGGGIGGRLIRKMPMPA